MAYDKVFLTSIITKAVDRINNGISKTLTARRTDEIPPQDPRHLTDTRTRVSTLLEYSLSYEMNYILQENGGNESISNVLWNVFPDLVVRNQQRENIMGLEVKALHTAAEEKSANLSTPLPLIRKGKDFIIIIIWGWVQESINNTSITYPHIHEVGIFDAWLIAKIRDITWLINTGDRVEGIDISTPILNQDETTFKAEEGNLGKLLRIHMSDKTSPNTPYFTEMSSEAKEYTYFTSKALYLGACETAKDICYSLDGEIELINGIDQYPEVITCIAIIQVGDNRVTVAAGPKRGKKWTQEFEIITPSDRLLHLGSKLQWEIYSGKDGWVQASSGKKPDIELERICEELKE